ncbi:MAG: sigma-70 family RNA polymerase sigma factor [Saprospiraceae bacterium]|nr:sigma-70 family RNA polymerase sigma factor [Saprospiraceae bacterium]
MTDGQLIHAILSGDTEAFSSLVEQHQDYVYTVCYSVLKNKVEAQEAAQDTFIKVYKSLEHYNEGAKLRSWMYKIAYRTALDYIRKRKYSDDLDIVEMVKPDSDMRSDQKMEKDDLNAILSAAIDDLPEDEAVLIRLFYLEEMNVKELEEITGLSNSNIKVKLFRARKHLQKQLRHRSEELSTYL